ncbi:MAG: hypothetical protein JY451_04565 [Erythrobacter sp.]|nr:MAG: hypothetical protein JY451_04565 [Erythrobacter sp.]
MLCLLIAAVLGLTGSGGYFSSQKLQAGPHQIELPAISRWAAADSMTMTVNAPAGSTAVLVPAQFGDVFSIESISPQPASVVGTAEGDEFTFDLQPSNGTVTIDFALRATNPAWLRQLGEFRVNGAESGAASVTVLP